MKKLISAVKRLDWATIVIISALLQTLVLECLNRHSLIGGFAFAAQPAVFLINVLLVLDTLFVAFLFKRRAFVFCLIHILWLTCGIINCVTTLCRTLPFTFIDLTMVKDAITLFDVYFNLFQRILIISAFAAGLALIVLLFIKLPRSERMPIPRFVGGGIMLLVLTVGSLNLALTAQLLSTDMSELNHAYHRYGFAYCFISTFADNGVDRPDNYSPEIIEQVEEQLNPAAPDHTSYTIRPNVVFVQLESFFDPKTVIGLDMAADPVPNFTQLKKNFPSGRLTMPSIGGGTANSEFEILTGMTLAHFGAGEYPYNTVLKEHAVESICYNLDSLNYTSHAIHNHTGTFYSRHQVYPNLGFDSYTSLEYMQDYDTNPLGWATDEVLTDEIMKAIHSTAGYDFVFCVSVQAHGDYPDEPLTEETVINGGAPETASYWGLDYYLQQISEVDDFIGDLVSELEKSEEPTMVVFYGDHLPSLGLVDEDLQTGTLYQTEYLIWNNYSSMLQHIADKDLYAYQLSAYATDLLNIHEGSVSRLHQSYLTNTLPENVDYMNALQLLEYNMLYGPEETDAVQTTYSPSHMRMGLKPIALSSLTVSDEALILHGNGFTAASQVFFGEEQMHTIHVSPTLLVVPELPDDGAAVSVGQVPSNNLLPSDKVTLSSSNSIIFSNTSR